MGSIYVPVDASVANNGIMTLDASGGGQTGGGYWINWDVSGFIGKGWFWDDPNNHLSTGWENAVTAGGGYVGEGCSGDGPEKPHTASRESFLIHVQNGHSENLDAVLAAWDDDSKLDFLKSNTDVFMNCTA